MSSYDENGYYAITGAFSGEPELVIGEPATGSAGFALGRAYDNSTFDVRNFSGVGKIRGNYDTATAEAVRTIRTKQTKDTEFNGNFQYYGTAPRKYTALTVYGEEASGVHSLTLTGANETTKDLTINSYGKVVFSSTGSWAGKVSVGANGWLESTNATALTSLELADGSHIVFPTSSSSLTGITSLTFAEGSTTYISFPAGAPDSGTIIDWTSVGSAPAGTFVLEGAAAETHILTKRDSGLIIAKAYGSVTTTTGTTTLCSSAVVFNSRVTSTIAAGNLDYITIITSGDVSVAWYAEAMRIRNLGGATISITGVSEEYEVSSSTQDGITTYTYTNVATDYTWSGNGTKKVMHENDSGYDTVADPAWSNAGNWTFVNSSSETVTAKRYPQAGDSVTFDTDATVEIAPSASAAFAAISIGDAEVEWMRSGDSGTVTISATGGIVLTDENASLAVGPNITLATPVTTDVEGKGIKWVTEDGTTTYSVVDPVAQIGDVKYGSLANAIEVAANNDTITLLDDCFEAIDLDGKSITFSEGEYTFTGSFTGTGTLTLSAWLKQAATARWANPGWEGTVVIPAFTVDQVIELNKYGISGSTVRVMGGSVGWLSTDVVNPTIELGADWSLPYFSPSFNNTLTKLKGTHKLTLASTSAVDLSLDAYSPYLLIKDVSEFTGSLETHTAGMVLGRNDKPSDRSDGGKILVYGTDAKVFSGKTWAADSGVVVNGTLTVEGTLSGATSASDSAKLVVDGASATVSGALTLAGGSTLSFDDEDSALAATSVVLPESGTVSLDFATGYTFPEIGDTAITLLTTGTTGLDLNKFAFDESIAGQYCLAQDGSGNVTLSHAKAKIGAAPYASVSDALSLMYYETDHSVFVQVLDDSYNPESYEYKSYLPTFGIFWNDTAQTYEFGEAVIGSTYYQTLDAAVGVGGYVKLNKNVTANITLPAGVSLNLNGYTLTGTVTTVEDHVVGQTIDDDKTVYTSHVNTTGESWTDSSGDHAWNNYANWSLGFVPVANTPVTFPSGTHTVGLSTHDGSETCATITMTGNVTLQRQDTSTWAYISLCGNVSGDGTLTLERVGLKTANNGAITIGCPVIGNATSNDNFFSGSGSTWTFSGAVEVRAGQFKADYVNLVFNGLVTLKDGVEIYGNGGSSTTSFNGGIAVSDNASASFGVYGNDTHTIASTVTLGSGARLTVPTSKTTVSSATFVTEESGKAVTASVNGSNTIYAAAVVPISNDSEAASGYMENATAVITNTTADITVPASATAVALAFSTGNSIELTSETVDLTYSGKVIVYATDANGAKTSTDISGAFKVTKSDNTYTVALDGTKTVGGVTVQPEVAASEPMTLTGDAPVFKIKTIPGLWYSVQSGTNPSTLSAGTPMQATGATTTLNQATELGDEETVRYYKIAVGASKAALE